MTTDQVRALVRHGVAFCLGCGALWLVGPYDFRPPFYCTEACADRLSAQLGTPSGRGCFGFLSPADFPGAQPIGTSTLTIEKIPDPVLPSPSYIFRPRYRTPVFTLGPDAPAWLRALIAQEFGAPMS